MSLHPEISSDEWAVRCELAALYRLLGHFRMTDLIDTHISARVPGNKDHFLINRYGIPFERMRASDLVKIDIDGAVVETWEQSKRVNAAGFVVHSAVHAARHDAACVVHTHTPAGIAVAAQKHGLLPISQHALKFYGRLSYHDYEGIALSLDERTRLVKDLGNNNSMILRSHGLLACGKTIPHAFHDIYFLERACQAQVQAMAGGTELVEPSADVCTLVSNQFQRDEVDEIVMLGWSAALSLIETQKASYCS